MAVVWTEGSFRNGVYSYAHIYQLNAEDFVVEIHHGDILYYYFPTSLVNSKKQQKASFHTIPCCARKA